MNNVNNPTTALSRMFASDTQNVNTDNPLFMLNPRFLIATWKVMLSVPKHLAILAFEILCQLILIVYMNFAPLVASDTDVKLWIREVNTEPESRVSAGYKIPNTSRKQFKIERRRKIATRIYRPL